MTGHAEAGTICARQSCPHKRLTSSRTSGFWLGCAFTWSLAPALGAYLVEVRELVCKRLNEPRVASGELLPSLPEMICQERPNPAVRIFSGLSIVLRPMAKHHSPGVEDLNIEGMVSARISDELDRRSRASPVRHCARAIIGGCPVVEFADENERRYARAATDHAANVTAAAPGNRRSSRRRSRPPIDPVVILD